MPNHPEPLAAYENRWHDAFDRCKSLAERRGLVEMLETLEGKREQFQTWASSGMSTTYTPHDLEAELVNDLPVNFVARCLALVISGNEQLRQELRAQLVPEINKMIEHHAELQAEHDATLEATEACHA